MSNSKKFVIADVFTEKRFCGNQVAVFTDGSGLNDATMQDIAREMNYSETTFLFPPASAGDYRVRIFTPNRELPFAGHPIVGTAYVIVAEKMKRWSEPQTAVTLEAGVGPVPVLVETSGGRPGRSTMTQPLPVVRGSYSDIPKLAKALSLNASVIEDTGLPVEIIFNGLGAMIVPVVNRAAIESLKVDGGALQVICNEAGASTVLTFALDTVLPTSTAHCRVFAPAAGVHEDAATGSANGPLGFYLVNHKLIEHKPTTSIVSEQGFEMNRPSLLYIDVDVDLTTNTVTEVRVGGGVVISGRGEILVD